MEIVQLLLMFSNAINTLHRSGREKSRKMPDSQCKEFESLDTFRRYFFNMCITLGSYEFNVQSTIIVVIESFLSSGLPLFRLIFTNARIHIPNTSAYFRMRLEFDTCFRYISIPI